MRNKFDDFFKTVLIHHIGESLDPDIYNVDGIVNKVNGFENKEIYEDILKHMYEVIDCLLYEEFNIEIWYIIQVLYLDFYIYQYIQTLIR